MASVSRRTLRCSADNRPSRARRLGPCPSLVGWLGRGLRSRPDRVSGTTSTFPSAASTERPPFVSPLPVFRRRVSPQAALSSTPRARRSSRGEWVTHPPPRVCACVRAIMRWAFGPRGAARHQAARRSKFRGGPPAHPAGRQNGLWSPTRIVGGRLKSGTGATGLEPATSGVTGRPRGMTARHSALADGVACGYQTRSPSAT